MRATTGRAVSAAIHSRLREALTSGKPLTYSQLAEHAGCTVRSVRNYLARAEEIFGFQVERYRDGGHSVLVHAVDVPVSSAHAVPASAAPPDPFGSAMADACLPHRAGAGQRRAEGLKPAVIFAFPGLPTFGVHQSATLEAFVAACSATPPRPIRLRLVDATNGASELSCWAVSVIVHSIDGIHLAALPLEADGIEALRTIDLALVDDVPDALTILETADVAEPPVDLAGIDLVALLGSPFCGRLHPDAQAVNVHLRFSPGYARLVQSRVWHGSQHIVVRRDGAVDVRFGPVPIDAAASWAASFGRAVEIMGDKRLRKAVKKRNFESV